MASPWKHPKTGVYYFRRRVPAHLLDVIGRKEVKKTLHTKDPKEAKRLFNEVWADTEAEWELAAKPTRPLPQKRIAALAGEAYRTFVAQMDEEPGEPDIWVNTLRMNDNVLERGQLEQWYGGAVDTLLRKHGEKPDAYSRQRLLEAYHHAIRQASEVNLRKAQGDYSGDPQADRFPPLTHSRDEPTHIDVLDLLKAWTSNHRKLGRSERTVEDWCRAVTEFTTFIGHSDATRVNKSDVVKWRRHLKDERGLSPKTVNGKKLAALNSVFSHGVADLLIEANPAEGVSEKTTRPRRERPQGFTQEEAEAILDASLNAERTEAGTAPRTRLAYRWVPWICAYTGARSGEITQLRKEDVFDEDIPFIRITPEAGSVKTGQYRDVPIHPHLLEHGFLEFVAGRPDGPLFYDPKSARRGGSGGVVRDKLAKWVRKSVGITDPRILPNHAWRHRFKTMAREANIPTEYTDAIQGHSDGRASTAYGEVTVKTLEREISKIPRYASESICRVR